MRKPAAAERQLVPGGQTPVLPQASGGQTPVLEWQRSGGDWVQQQPVKKRVTFADRLVEYASDYNVVSAVDAQGSKEPHLPPQDSLDRLLGLLLHSGLELEPFLPGTRNWCTQFADTLASEELGKRHKNMPPNFWLGVCVVCPAYQQEQLMATLPVLVSQLVRHMGAVRIYLMIPNTEGIMEWTCVSMEFAMRLQLLRVCVANTTVWHDAVWRNAIAQVAIDDGASVAGCSAASVFKVVSVCVEGRGGE